MKPSYEIPVLVNNLNLCLLVIQKFWILSEVRFIHTEKKRQDLLFYLMLTLTPPHFLESETLESVSFLSSQLSLQPMDAPASTPHSSSLVQ